MRTIRSFSLAVLRICFLLVMCISGQAAANELNVTMNIQSGSRQPVDWCLQLSFSKEISILDFSRHVKLTVDGKNEVFRVVNRTEPNGPDLPQPLPGSRNTFVIQAKTPSLGKASCKVVVNQGLADVSGKVKLTAAKEISFVTCPTVDLVDLRPFAEGDDKRGITVKLSAVAGLNDLERAVRILPPVGRIRVTQPDSKDKTVFALAANFESGKVYTFSLRPQQLADSEAIFRATERQFTAKGAAPWIKFDIDRSVLELHSRQIIPVALRNVQSLQCQLTRIPPVFAPEFSPMTLLAASDERRPNASNEMGPSTEQEDHLRRQVTQLEQRLVEAVSRNEALSALDGAPLLKDFLGWEFQQDRDAFLLETLKDKQRRFSLPLSFRSTPHQGGAVLVQVKDPDNNEVQQVSRVFQVTDLSLTYKFSAANLVFWVTSLETGKPVADVGLMLFTDTDERFLLGRTNADGLLTASQDQEYSVLTFSRAKWQIEKRPLQIHRALCAVAAAQGDSCFIQLHSNRFKPYLISQSAPDESLPHNRNGHLFTERGVYRQGETVFWKATVRMYEEQEVVASPGDQALISIYSPIGNLVTEEKVVLNEFGTASGAFHVKGFAPLGRYSITLDLQNNEQKPDSGSGHNSENGHGVAAQGQQETGTGAGTETGAGAGKWDMLMGRVDLEGKKIKRPAQETEEKLIRLAETGFQVQTFEPPRHFVEIQTAVGTRKNNAIVGRPSEQETLECTIQGKYYTGGPVRHAKTRWTAFLVSVAPDIPGYGHYAFGSNDPARTMIESGESLLDENGKVTVTLPLDKTIKGGMYGIELSATVLDVDARPATGVEKYVPTPAVRIGISRPPSQMTEGDDLPLEVVALDAAGKPVSTGVIRLDIRQKRWFYTQKRDENGDIYYHWDSGWLTTLAGEQPLKDGKAIFDLHFGESGDFQIQAKLVTPQGEFMANHAFEVGYIFQSYTDSDGRNRRRSDAEIALVPLKEPVAVGDEVTFNFHLPRSSPVALMTCEQGGILEQRLIPVQGRRGSFSVKIEPRHRPTLYVSIAAAAGRAEFPLYRSQVDQDLPRMYYGYAKMTVLTRQDGMTVAITDETQDSGTGDLHGRPGGAKELHIVARDLQGRPLRCEMAVCVVDEAILALTGYITPTLGKLLDFSLPLSVFSGDLRFSLITQELYRLLSTNPLTGGGMGAGGIAADIDLRKDFRPVAYWNAGLLTDEQGKASVSFSLPDSTTAYRIYVISADKGSAFCSTQRNLVVSKEFYLQPGLPRFLTVGDEVRAPLTACNKTDAAGMAHLEVSQVTNVAATLEKSEISLEPFTNSVAMLALKADGQPGDASLVCSGRRGAFQDAIQETFPVKSRYLLTQRALQGHFVGKDTVSIPFPENLGVLSRAERLGTMKAILSLSRTQWSRIVPGLRYMLCYPYGCLEQKSSGIIALAAIRKLAQDGMIPGIPLSDVDGYLAQGITHILKMQTVSGGFGYWSGDLYASWWGTQYAVLALTLAQEAGLDVPSENLNKALEYLRDRAFAKTPNNEHFRYGINALMAVNLAWHGKLKPDELEVVQGRFGREHPEAEAMLVWARALCNKPADEALKKAFAALKVDSQPGEITWWHSPHRHTAVVLLAGLMIDPASKRNDDLAGSLLAAIGPCGRWNSTADSGLCLFALARYFAARGKVVAEKDFQVTVQIPGQPEHTVTLGTTGHEMELDIDALPTDGKITITADQKSMVNWNLQLTYPQTSTADEDLCQGFFIDKTVQNLNGGEEIRVGDLVKITVEFEDDLHRRGKYGRYEYVAIEDPLPAGFIAVNPALKNEQAPSDQDNEEGNDEWYCGWNDGAYTFNADHFERHDDRVLAFRNRLWSGRFRLTYHARAICEGTFHLRPTRISLMYHPDYFGMTQSRTLKILPVAK